MFIETGLQANLLSANKPAFLRHAKVYMGCMHVQQRSLSGSISSFSRRKAQSNRTVLRSSPLPTKPILSHEGWKVHTVRALTRLQGDGQGYEWLAAVKTAVLAWNTEGDIRWRENLKWYYLHAAIGTKRKSSSGKTGKKSIWMLPGMSAESVFMVSDQEFLENQLRCSITHGIAYMLAVFITEFSRIYSSPTGLSAESGTLAEAMKRDIADFSTLAEDSLELYYEPIDLLALFRKSRQFLGFLIRDVILEDSFVNTQLLAAIRASRIAADSAISSQFTRYANCELLEIHPAAKDILVQVSRADPGFNASIHMLHILSEQPRLKDQVQTLFRVSEGVHEAVMYHLGAATETLEADDLLALFVFFVLRAGVDLGSHVELLTSLVPTDVMADATSYSLATLEGALDFIAFKLPK